MIGINKASSKVQTKPNTKAKIDASFLEALRDLGSDFTSTASNDLINKGKNDIMEGLFPFKQTEDSSQNKEGVLKQESNYWKSRFIKSEQVRNDEKMVFTRQEKEIKNQVQSLQNEISQLAKATGELAKQAQVASIQEIPSPGIYHKNFLSWLIRTIKELRKQVQESSYWLASWNKKAQKRGFYWKQAKKSGASFTLNNDRTVATQAG